MAGGKITLREAQAIAYLLEHGRWPDPQTAEWLESRASRVALDFLLSARLRGTIAAALVEWEEGWPRKAARPERSAARREGGE